MQKNLDQPNTKAMLVAAILALISLDSMAVEAASPIPVGAENFLAGAAPPPGFYVLAYGQHYSTDRALDGSGKVATPADFKLIANAAVARLTWSTEQRLLDGHLLWGMTVPLVKIDGTVGGTSTSKSGLGDIAFGPAVAYHHSASLHSAVAVNLQLPTGSYDKASPFNIGNNYRSVQLIHALSHINPTGFNADYKATYSLNSANSATGYKSGSEFVVDYSLGWGVAPHWVAGLGGYVRTQVQSDSGEGVATDGKKASANGLGPSVIYNTGKGFFVAAKYQKDFSVRNTTQGTALWLKATVPF
ncbi:transporter [Limnohabitans sp.]|uniref:SphA family protein n=1 Tax=Limnohabitans sp. TaxID=1907725 RepID=UPI00286F5498|nr:transporter [Limnohabitans sp.]